MFFYETPNIIQTVLCLQPSNGISTRTAKKKQVIRQYFEAYAVRFAVHEREKKFLLVTQSRTGFKLATNNDNLLKQIIEAENSHDIERLLALVTDDMLS